MTTSDLISTEQIERLVKDASGSTLLSLYMPTYRAGPETQQNPIRFRNLLVQAREQFAARGMRDAEVSKRLAPLEKLRDDTLFWRHQSEGLALFQNSDHTEYYRLPLQMQETVVVGDRFHLKPLFPLLSGDGRFFVLAVSQNEARLLQCTRHTWSQVQVPDMPAGKEEVMQYLESEPSVQFHSRTPSGRAEPGGNRPAQFHSQGGVKDDVKARIFEYFRHVDAAIQPVVRDLRIPMVFAGVEYLLPIYREANRYPNLLNHYLPGNPDHVDDVDLHHQAWQLVAPVFNTDREEAADRFQQLEGTAQASSILEEVVPAACEGRIAELFVACDQARPGRYDSENRSVIRHEETQPSDGDLLDIAAVNAFLNRGRVYAVPTSEVPGENAVAAIYRY